jgi:hypothetical protein
MLVTQAVIDLGYFILAPDRQVKYIMSQFGKGKGGGGVRPVFIHFSGLIISPLKYA